jgi:hypothetical protein
MIEVSSREAAWELAERLFPTGYRKSLEWSKEVGYDVYVSTEAGVGGWISDQDDYLELHLPDGSNEDIWIADSAITFGNFLKLLDDRRTRIYIRTEKFTLNISGVYGSAYHQLGLDDEDFACLCEKNVVSFYVDDNDLHVILAE